MKKSKNENLCKAKAAKNDEFYTQLVDIERELVHYKDHFKDKVILCNCDDPLESNFFKYFFLNFRFLGLKELITTCYKSQGFQCPHKNEELDISQMQADHIIPWSRGGKTVIENCQMLCRECNNKKRDKM